MREGWEVIAEAIERLEACTQTRRRTPTPATHDEFAVLERQRLMAWATESTEHAEAIAWLADHALFTLECVALYRYDVDQAHDLIDATFHSLREAFK